MFLSDIPKELNAPPDWRANIQRYAPLTENALRYAENHELHVQYEYIADDVDRSASVVPFSHTLTLGYNENVGMPHFLHRAAHETKHHSQIGAAALLFGWHQLRQDLLLAKKLKEADPFKEPRMRQHYNLPAPVTSTLVHIVTEIDALNFGLMCEVESAQALDRAEWKTEGVDQDLIDETHHDLMRDDNLYIQYVAEHMNMLLDTADLARQHVENDNRLPKIQLVDIPVTLIIGSIKRLWRQGPEKPAIYSRDEGGFIPPEDEPGLISPFAREEGAMDLVHLMEEIHGQPGFDKINMLTKSYLRPVNRVRRPLGGLDFS